MSLKIIITLIVLLLFLVVCCVAIISTQYDNKVDDEMQEKFLHKYYMNKKDRRSDSEI